MTMAKRNDGGTAFDTVRGLAKTPGHIGPLMVGLGVAGWLVTLHLVELIPQTIQWSGFVGSPLPIERWVTDLIIGAIVFLAFWIVAPIAGELDLRHVIMRAALVTGIAATVSWVVSVVITLVKTLLACTAPALVGLGDRYCEPFGTYIGVSLPATLGFELLYAVAFAVFIAPAVILGAVLLWMRRRERPLDAQVSGIIDV